MQDIYGNNFLIISKDDYNYLLDEIEHLKEKNKEMHDFICSLTNVSIESFRDNVSFLLKQMMKS